jgi:DNA-binding FrmR family transcriptional regulator
MSENDKRSAPSGATLPSEFAHLDDDDVRALAKQIAAVIFDENPVARDVLRRRLFKAMSGHDTRHEQDKAGAKVLRDLMASLDEGARS